jgi:SAM-dependent methyltransferase
MESDMSDAEFREFYEEKVSTYGEIDPRSNIRYQSALSLADLAPGHRVLDIACRNGTLPKLLDQDGPAVHYTGLDIAQGVIDVNAARWPERTFVRADIMGGTPFDDGAFDRIFALEILEHVHSPLTMLKEIRRVLSDDGVLVLSVPNPFYWLEFVNEWREAPDDQGHIHSFTRANLGAVFKVAGLQIDRTSGTYLEFPRRIRGAWRNDKISLLTRIPPMLARSTVYRVHKVL